MCTVSYVPLKNGYILTSNRDENPSRNTIAPKEQQLTNGETIMAPIDEQKRGTWIATNTKDKTACLLNGAYKKHQRSLSYKRSRGHYIIEAFMYYTFPNFVEKVDLFNIEPFTLLFMERSEFHILIWDGNEKHHKTLDKHTPQLWSSSTLYTSEEHCEKENFFKNTLNITKSDKTQILELHGLKKETPFILDKPHIKTVSITQVIAKDNNITLNYYPKN